MATSVNRLVAARPYSAANVEAPDPDIIMRRYATSERTMTPAKTSTSPGDPMPGRHSTYQPRSRRLRNPDQLRRHERYRRAAGTKGELDNNPQLKGRMTVSDITGATGMRIIRAIVAGERDPDVLATYRDVRCHSSLETIRAALVGNDRDEHVFALTQSLELYDTYQAKILDCDRKLEFLMGALTGKGAKPIGKLSRPRVKTKQVNAPSFDVRTALYGLLGVDLTEIHGLGPSLALKLIGECGTDLRAWPTAKHFTSWLCLAPGNKISGGKVLSSRTRRSSSRAAALLRLAATTIGRSNTALGAFYRRLSSRAGKAKAVTATARKIAVLFYNTLRHRITYRDPGAEQYEEQYRSRVVANLKRRAKSLGFVLQAVPCDAEMVVS